jgi:acyl-CoA thioester hydrolase
MKMPLETRYGDYDTKGHVNNAIYLTYFEMARAHAWLNDLDGDPDFPFILAEASVKYVSQARIGDPLEIEMTTSEVRTKGWEWRYVIRDRSDDRVVAEGRTVQVMFDYEKRATMEIPAALRERLLAL